MCVCKTEFPLLYPANATCLTSCPQGTHVNDERSTCVTCLSDEYFSRELRLCVAVCPSGSIVDRITKDCTCPSNKPYLYKTENRCVATCPFRASVNTITKVCFCPTSLSYLNVANFTCVSSCPSAFYSNEKTRVCNTCSNYFLEPEQTCAAECNLDMNIDKKRCFCPSDKPFYNLAIRTCVQSCPSN